MLEHKITKEEALREASLYGLEEEVRIMMEEENMSPEEALNEWDIY